MRIRTKTIAVVVITLIVLLVGLSFSLRTVMTNGFARVERADTEKNMNRVRDTVGAEVDGIENSILTWSQWDAAYNFVQGKAPTFVKENISNTIYTGMKINFIVYTDAAGKVILQGGYDTAKGKNIPVPPGLMKLLGSRNKLLANTDLSKTVKGVMMVDDTPLMLVSAPVTNTAANKPRAGYVIFARQFDAAEAKRLSSVTHMAVSFDPSSKAILGIVVSPKDENTIEGKATIKDIFGNPILTSTIENPRSIYQEGKKDLSYMIGSLLIAGIVFGIAILALLEFAVIRRAVRLSKEVTGITESMDFDRPLAVGGSDEITSLASSVNGLLAACSEVINSVRDAA